MCHYWAILSLMATYVKVMDIDLRRTASLNIKIIHEVAIIAMDLIFQCLIAKIIQYIVIVSFKSSYNGSNLFFIRVNRYSEQTCVCMYCCIKVEYSCVVAFYNTANFRNSKLATFHFQNYNATYFV